MLKKILAILRGSKWFYEGDHKKHICVSSYKEDIIEKTNSIEEYGKCDVELRKILHDTSKKLADLIEKRNIP